MQTLEHAIQPPELAPLPNLAEHGIPFVTMPAEPTASTTAALDAAIQTSDPARINASDAAALTSPPAVDTRHESHPDIATRPPTAGAQHDAGEIRSNNHAPTTRQSRRNGKGNLSLKEAATTLTMLSKPASSSSHAQSASPESSPQPLPTTDSTSAHPSAQLSDAPDPTQPLLAPLADPTVALPISSSSSSSSTTSLIAPAPTDGQARYDTARSWPMRAGLQGTRAQFYRGPLGAEEVLSLLSQDISDNGRRALTAEARAGYLKYFHFLGPSEVPASKRRRGAAPAAAAAAANGEVSSSSGSTGSKTSSSRASPVGREGWQCRCCHHELHVPTGQIGNLSGHLYGTKGRPGCLELRAEKPAESIPPPPKDENGQLIRHGANKDQPMTRNHKAG